MASFARGIILLHVVVAALLSIAPQASALGLCAQSCYMRYARRLSGCHNSVRSIDCLCEEGGVPEQLVSLCHNTCTDGTWDAVVDPKPCASFGTGIAQLESITHIASTGTNSRQASLQHGVDVQEVMRSDDFHQGYATYRDAHQQRRTTIANSRFARRVGRAELASFAVIQRSSPASKDDPHRKGGEPSDGPHWALNSCGLPGESCAGSSSGGAKNKRGLPSKDSEDMRATSVIKPDPTLVRRAATTRPAFTWTPTLCTAPGIPCAGGAASNGLAKYAEDVKAEGPAQDDSLKVTERDLSSRKATRDDKGWRPTLCGVPGISCAGSGNGGSARQKRSTLLIDNPDAAAPRAELKSDLQDPELKVYKAEADHGRDFEASNLADYEASDGQ